MHSLRTKITTLAVCLIVIAVVAVSLTSVLFIRNRESGESQQLLLMLGKTGQANLDYYFRSVEQSVNAVADFTRGCIRGTDEAQMKEHIETVQTEFDRIAGKTNGVKTYYYRIDPEVSDEPGFWYVDEDGNGFKQHEVTRIEEYDTQDTSRLVWFTVPKHEQESIWLPPYYTEGLNRVRVISYNAPIIWRDHFIGVIGIEIDYSTLAEQVSSIRLYENGYAFLTDAGGRLIYHPRIDLATEETPPTPEGLVGDITFTRYIFNGVKKITAWQELSNGMRLYVAVPENETEGEWQQMIRHIIIAASVVILISVILTYLVTTHITRPLKQLTEAARQTDQGNYDFALAYDGNDEVGTLTNTFKRMAEHMSEHISDLNRRANVDALTSVRNKGAFTSYIEDMQRRLDEKPEEEAEFAIGVFDCDDLKTVNDEYGHDKGDIYLKTASRLICRVFQHSPVFRIGGDEFAVVLRNDDFRQRSTLEEVFRTEMKTACQKAENCWEEVHVAMGVAVYDPEQDHSVIDTVRRADKAMYVNKRQRKNG